MDHNSSQSNIPVSKLFRTKTRSQLLNCSLNNSNHFNTDQLDESSKFVKWKSNENHFKTDQLDESSKFVKWKSNENHFNTDQLDESSRFCSWKSNANHFNTDHLNTTKFINWNVSYLKDAKKCFDTSVYYLKNEAQKRSWFRSKKIWSIIAIVSSIIIGYNYCSNPYTVKYTELENEMKSIKQIILENELNRKLNNEDNKFNSIQNHNSLESTNFESNLDEMINGKIDKIIIENIEHKIKQLIDNELDFKLTHLIDLKLDEQLIDELKNQINLHLTEELTRKLNEKLMRQLNEKLTRQLEEQINEKLKYSTSLSTDRIFLNNSIRTVIHDLILDKESKPDYASELNNAFVLDSSPTYINYSEAIVIFSIPLYSTSGSPNSLLKRNPNLFEYYPKPWKMQSDKGFIKIKLAKSIIPESFIYEHIIRSSILDENQLTCSPKIFNVIGYENENSIQSISLGRFHFKLSEDDKIYEPKFIFDKIETKISIIQFNIEDNYGNSNYTCMHRLKVF